MTNSKVFLEDHSGTILKSVTQAAHLLGISTRYLGTLTRKGDLRSHKLGKRVLYTDASLQEFIASKACVAQISPVDPAPIAS